MSSKTLVRVIAFAIAHALQSSTVPVPWHKRLFPPYGEMPQKMTSGRKTFQVYSLELGGFLAKANNWFGYNKPHSDLINELILFDRQWELYTQIDSYVQYVRNACALFRDFRPGHYRLTVLAAALQMLHYCEQPPALMAKDHEKMRAELQKEATFMDDFVVGLIDTSRPSVIDRARLVEHRERDNSVWHIRNFLDGLYVLARLHRSRCRTKRSTRSMLYILHCLAPSPPFPSVSSVSFFLYSRIWSVRSYVLNIFPSIAVNRIPAETGAQVRRCVIYVQFDAGVHKTRARVIVPRSQAVCGA